MFRVRMRCRYSVRIMRLLHMVGNLLQRMGDDDVLQGLRIRSAAFTVHDVTQIGWKECGASNSAS